MNQWDNQKKKKKKNLYGKITNFWEKFMVG